MKELILSEEINSIKYLLGYNRGLVISEQQTVSASGTTPSGTVNITGTTASGTTPSGTVNITGATTTGTTVTTPATPIKIGFKYPSITELQNTLKTKFKSNLVPDGLYGPKTAASILSALQNLPKPAVSDASPEVTKKTDEVVKSPAVATNSEQNKNVQGTNAATVAGGGQSTLTNIDDIVS
jgi:hypothetical protein